MLGQQLKQHPGLVEVVVQLQRQHPGECNVSRSATSNTTTTATTSSSASASVAANTNNNAGAASVTNNNSNARASRSQAHSKGARTKGTKNFGNDEINSVLDLIEKVLPTGNELWELVADLHKERFSGMNCNATSIKNNNYKLTNEKPGTGNPSISSITLKAKQIKEAINVKAGVADADVTDFFEDYNQEEEVEQGTSVLVIFAD